MNIAIKILSFSILYNLQLALPTPITWQNLKDVKFQKKYFKEIDEYLLFPTFGESVKKLNGKQIEIRGYMIPVDVKSGLYVISALPMSSCFFCGGSGPETIMEVNFKQKGHRFKTDDLRTIRGTLKLNDSDLEHLNYILSEAEIIK